MSDATYSCPVGYACLVCRTPAPACIGFPEACGAAAGEPCEPGCPSLAADGNDLTVSIADTGYGPTCITRCAVCTAEGRYPQLTGDAALRLALEHREHTAEAGQ